ncbi:MAG: imidazolonepropionase [Candidatus Krumholzibacteriota bacterium]|nr:imidazolonepropionase [Candidatus Krumholzibacteriota bacterium]
MPETIDLLLLGAGQLITCGSSGKGPRRGKGLSDPGLVRNGAIAVKNGRIFAVGSEAAVRKRTGGASIVKTIDAEGRTVLPGWVDPHTHAVFSTYRADEYEARIRGDSYLQIEERGGGIKRSVHDVREIDEERLFQISRRRLMRMLEGGVTTLEIKSGYGLEREAELKMLRVISRLAKETPLDIAATFMGAHQKPPEHKQGDEFVRLLVEDMIPAVAASGLAEFMDVFCEKGVFDLEETRRILEAGKSHGFKLKVHADEIFAIGGTELAVEMGAVSVEHLVQVTPRGIEKLSTSDTVAVLLPGTSLGLASRKFAPARELIEAGAAVALATDFNPGSAPSSSMQLAVALACSQMGMIPAQAILAATYNAACAINREKEVGSLEIGKKADIVIYDVEDYREIPSRAGLNHAVQVLKEGRVVWEIKDYKLRSEVGL